MLLSKFLNYAKLSLNAVSETFAPSPGSTKREVRINGAICILVGFLFLAVGIGITFTLKSPEIALRFLIIPALFSMQALL